MKRLKHFEDKNIGLSLFFMESQKGEEFFKITLHNKIHGTNGTYFHETKYEAIVKLLELFLDYTNEEAEKFLSYEEITLLENQAIEGAEAQWGLE